MTYPSVFSVFWVFPTHFSKIFYTYRAKCGQQSASYWSHCPFTKYKQTNVYRSLAAKSWIKQTFKHRVTDAI